MMPQGESRSSPAVWLLGQVFVNGEGKQLRGNPVCRLEILSTLVRVWRARPAAHSIETDRSGILHISLHLRANQSEAGVAEAGIRPVAAAKSASCDVRCGEPRPAAQRALTGA